MCRLSWNLWTSTSWNPHGLYRGCFTFRMGPHLYTLPCIVTPYRDSVDGTRGRVTYQKLVTRWHYGFVRCAVGIRPSHQRDDTVTAGAGVDVQRHVARPHLLRRNRRVTNFWYVTRSRVPSTLSRYGVTIHGKVTSVYPPLHVSIFVKIRFSVYIVNQLYLCDLPSCVNYKRTYLHVSYVWRIQLSFL